MIEINNRLNQVAKIATQEHTKNLKEKQPVLVLVRLEVTAKAQPNPQTKTKLARLAQPVRIAKKVKRLHAQKARTTMKLVETVSLRVKTAV